MSDQPDPDRDRKATSESLPRTLALLEQGRAEGLHRGAQLYVSRSGACLADLGWGESRQGVSMTAETLLPWMSCTKPVAAVAVAQLRERGLLDFDDRVVRFIPEFGGGKEKVTLRHLLTHTAGFRSLPVPGAGVTWDEMIAAICAMELEPGWVPGETAGYHISTSWFILGEVIRRIDGRDYGRYVREEIFMPLGMRDSWVGMPVEQYRAYGERIGVMHSSTRGILAPQSWSGEEHATACIPGGSGYGPMHDLGRFYEMLLGGGVLGERILSAESVALLTRRQRIGLFDETFRHVIDWGLGFIVDSKQYGPQTVPYSFGLRCSPRTFGHGGSQSSASFGDPESGLVVALALNGMPGEARHNKRIRLLTTAIYEDLAIGAS